MADFLHATDLGSDTDDKDYVPEGAAGGAEAAEAVSEEENSGEDEDDLDNETDGKKPKKRAKKQKKSAVPTARGANLALDAEERKAEEMRKKEFAREKEEIKVSFHSIT